MRATDLSTIRQALDLALQDFIYERRSSVCFSLALMAVLAPLLILFGLKFGLIDTVANRLIEDPRNRELIGLGAGRFSPSWFDAMRARADVSFVIPNTRSIAATFARLTNPATRASEGGVAIVPTAAGDPLLEGIPLPRKRNEIVLSASLAAGLGVAAGSVIEAQIDRRRHERAETASVELLVIGIAPAPSYGGAGAFVPLELLVATEDYRDGLAVPEFGWGGSEPPTGPRFFPRFRLYARSIFDVAELADALKRQGVEVRTQAAEIASMQSLDRNLSLIFWLVAAVGGSGFLVSLAANLHSHVDRKRKELSILRLIGLPVFGVVLMPMAQSALIAIIGAISAAAIAVIGAMLLNRLFIISLQPGEMICRLLPYHLIVAFFVTLASALAASAWAAIRAGRIDPAEEIRDV
jgi:putative ABC transport system permease protein